MSAHDEESTHKVPEWIVTYGDMMSLLLTFFIMLVSLSEVIAEQRYQAILDALQKYVGFPMGPKAPPGKSFPLNSLLKRLETLGSFTNEELGRGGVRTPALEGESIRVYRTREGSAVRVGEAVPFSPHEITLSDEARDQLRKIATHLAGKPNKIDIQAHASSVPLPPGSPFADSYALTYQRGYAVREFLEKQGIAPDRMRISCRADLEPLPRLGDKRSQQDDRVEIYILDVFFEEFIGPRHSD